MRRLDSIDAFSSADTPLRVTDREIIIGDLRLQSVEGATYLADIAEAERPRRLAKLVDVGAVCLQRAEMNLDADFVKRKMDQLLHDMEITVAEALKGELLDKLGMGEGQALKPVKEMVESATRSIRLLFDSELDPTKDSSTIGRALRNVLDLLDEDRTDSVQAKITEAVTTVTGEDGALARSVGKVVSEAVKPLVERVDSLAKEVHGKQVAEEAVMQTIEKGRPYELQAVAELQEWARVVGANVDHVGGDSRPGDIVLEFTGTSVAADGLRMVVEARDRQRAMGRKAVEEDLVKKMLERDAGAAIFLSKTSEGLGHELGEFAEGENERGPWVATTHEYLRIAVRFLLVLNKLRAVRSEMPQIDGSQVESNIQRIRSSLKRINTINRKVTDIRQGADDINSLASALREEVQVAVLAIEDAMRVTAER